MFRLKMKTTLAGPNICANAGSIIEVATKAEADALVDGKYAELITKASKVETAAISPAENAAMPGPTTRRRARGGDEA